MKHLWKSSFGPIGRVVIAWVGIVTLCGALGAAAQDYDAWRYVQAVHFNTSKTGADVYYDVHDFPVAVSLDSSTFDFSQATADGSDLRFSNERDRSPLPYSIEYWDQDSRRALVWVKVPTVKGQSTGPSMYMHWGNPAAGDAGDANEVFATRDGFVGVWHLDEDGNTDEGGYKDATANEAHGTGVNLTPRPRAEGRLGRALELRYVEEQWVKIDSDKRKLFDLTTRLTFSIWARASTYSNTGDSPGYETMFAKGDNSWRLQKFGIRSWHQPEAELIEICIEKPPSTDLCTVGKADLVAGEWFHLVGVHDFPLVKLYVNGVLDSVELFDVNWTSDDHPVGIGNQSQFPERGRWWDGLLDEARVMDVPKDDYWIKLDYESQREGQQFLSFGDTEQRF